MNRQVMGSNEVTVSVPTRIDVGGTWDLKAFGLLFHKARPATVNIAVDLPITLRFSMRQDALIAISDPYFNTMVDIERADFRGPFGLLLAICSYYGWQGFSLDIEYTVPPRNGLGGSGALAAGFIVGMKYLKNDPNSEYRDIAQAVHEVEESLRFSYCGLQDQCAALYGGVSKWEWAYRDADKYTRTQLLSPEHYSEITDRLLIAYLGRPHGLDINKAQVESVFDPATRPAWFRINELTHRAADCIEHSDWESLADCISEENDIRLGLIPERLAPEACALMSVCTAFDTAFGIAGAGAGGCVFAFAPTPTNADTVRERWKDILALIPGAVVYDNLKVSLGVKACYETDIGAAIYEPEYIRD